MTQFVKIEEEEFARYAGDAVTVTPGNRKSDIILLCEHGGLKIPEAWNNLGLSTVFLETHFGSDLGSRNLTLATAERLGATAVLSNYSRIFLDYNRKKHDPSCIRTDLGGIPIPGNLHLNDEERNIRERIARHPFEKAVAGWVESEAFTAKAVISIHSFSPFWENTFRSCEIGVMWKQDDRLPIPLINAIRQQGVFKVDDNEPYSFKENDWFTLDRHGLSLGVPNAYIEVRNDLIQETSGVEKLSAVIANAIENACTSL